MSLYTDLKERVVALLFRDREDRELAEELRFHLEMEEEANLRRGMSPEEARRRAAITLGGVEQTREAVRDAGHAAAGGFFPRRPLRLPLAGQDARLHRHHRTYFETTKEGPLGGFPASGMRPIRFAVYISVKILYGVLRQSVRGTVANEHDVPCAREPTYVRNIADPIYCVEGYAE